MDCNRAALMLMLEVTRCAGRLIHGRGKRRTWDEPDTDKMVQVARFVTADCASEWLRRQGILAAFEPGPDPFRNNHQPANIEYTGLYHQMIERAAKDDSLTPV
jgi:hypothetical protein